MVEVWLCLTTGQSSAVYSCFFCFTWATKWDDWVKGSIPSMGVLTNWGAWLSEDCRAASVSNAPPPKKKEKKILPHFAVDVNYKRRL